jgi:hypothetical protein
MPIRSVLVVDDEASMRHVLTLLLEERGISARACASGEDALAELEARPYDAVVTDVRMPRMSGIELLRRAREFAPGGDLLYRAKGLARVGGDHVGDLVESGTRPVGGLVGSGELDFEPGFHGEIVDLRLDSLLQHLGSFVALAGERAGCGEVFVCGHGKFLA